MATTMTPFLYQTRTILRGSVSLRSFSTTAGRPAHPPRPRSREVPIPFDWEGSASTEPRADIPSGPDGPEKSTITPTERHVFRKIFDGIARRGPTVPESATRQSILSQYPPSLRRAAEAALNMQDILQNNNLGRDSRIALSPDQEEAGKAREELQKAREQLRAMRVADLQERLDSCNTDFEVWDVLESEVFSMVEKLGIGARGPKNAKTPAKAPEETALSMDEYGPIYSLHLLQGLKALDQNFIQSSPLALNVVPRVRELGLASYVLGVSTPLYNELASILWHRHGDTTAVLAVLDEMQQAGLFYDENTLRLVEAIEMALDSFRGRQLGVFSKAIGTIPGYDLDVKSKFASRTRRVRHAVTQRRAKSSRRMS